MRRVHRALAICVAASSLLALIAYRGPETWLPVALLRYGPPLLPLLPLLVGVGIALAGRAWRLGLAALALTLLGAWALLPLRWHQARAERPAWTLLAWNVEKYDRGVTGVLETIGPIQADVICLTEAGDYFWHEDEAHKPNLLDASLHDYHRVAAGEIRVYSKLPVLEEHVYPLEHGEAGRPLVEVVVSTPRPIHVFCMHGPPSYAMLHLRGTGPLGSWSAWARQRQAHADEVAAHLPKDAAVILAGDFNCAEACSLWSTVALTDAWNEVGRGLGATMASGQRVDRVLVATDLVTELLGVHVQRQNASDHAALVTTFAR